MRLKHFIYSVFAGIVAVTMAACTPESDELGGISITSEQLAEGKGFTVDVDQTTNQVTFKSLVPNSYSVYWEYGPMPAEGAEASVSGTSTSDTYSLGIAFDGQYYVRMGVQTRGGIVFSDRAPFTIDNMNVALLSDPLWTLLTGGVGESKTWVLDIDANGTSIFFGGPKWFFTAGQNWNSFHDAKGANYIDSKSSWDGNNAIEPNTDWYWSADWASNSWICGAADYGTMTFDLAGGANVEVNGAKGTFNMDVDNHTISFTGILPLAIDQGAVEAQCPSGTYKLIYMSENAMQILFDGPNETPFSLNYVAKTYKDNYVPPVDLTIKLPVKWQDYIMPFNQKQTSYKFDEEAPYTYYSLSGEEITEGYEKFAANANITEALLEFNAATNAFALTDIDGNITEGTFSVTSGTVKSDDNGETYNANGGLFTFSSLPQFSISVNEDVMFGSRDNTLQLLHYEVSDLTGDVTDIWLGSKQYDAQGNAYCYLAYHFIKQTGGEQKESFTANLNFADTGWAFINGENVYITGEGDYTFTLNQNGSTNTQDPFLMYLDVLKLLKKHPNADIIIKSIKIDGNEILGSEEGLDDATISRGVGDDPTTGRRYILNPWNDESKTHTAAFKFSNTLEVTVTVKYDVGEVVLKPE